MISDQFNRFFLYFTFELPLSVVVNVLFCDFRQYPVSTVVVSPSFVLSNDVELLTLIFVVARTPAVVEAVAFVVVVADETFFVLDAGEVFVVFCF